MMGRELTRWKYGPTEVRRNYVLTNIKRINQCVCELRKLFSKVNKDFD